jgi:hypothetical protein
MKAPSRKVSLSSLDYELSEELSEYLTSILQHLVAWDGLVRQPQQIKEMLVLMSMIERIISTTTRLRGLTASP